MGIIVSDITQSMDADKIQFSANSPKADGWMRQNWGDHTISVSPSDAAEFTQAAIEAGFSVRPL